MRGLKVHELNRIYLKSLSWIKSKTGKQPRESMKKYVKHKVKNYSTL